MDQVLDTAPDGVSDWISATTAAARIPVQSEDPALPGVRSHGLDHVQAILRSAMLDQATAGRLVKLLGMLGSDHPGEVANAGAAAHRLLTNTGLTWHDVIAVESEPEPDAWQEPENWREAVCICLSLVDAPLSEWDRAFLIGISRRNSLTEKQTSQLDRIVATCRGHAQWQPRASGL